MLGPEVTAQLSRVIVAHDGDGYVLGRPDLALYLAVPEPGAEFVRALQAGDPLPVATMRASEVAGTEVDGEGFLSGLIAAGLCADATAERSEPGRRTREIRWVEGVSPDTARKFFGPAAWACYGLAAVLVVVMLATQPELRPSYEHAWWLPDPVLSLLLLTPAWLSLAAGHEAWHWLAGRAVGVGAIFRISYRGIFPVVETDLTQIVAIPRRKRYSAFLAGVAFDVVMIATALGLRLAYRADLVALPAWLDRLLAAIVLLQLLAIGWQAGALFLRNDMYAVLANALRCHDLYRATWLTSRYRMWRLSEAESDELATISDHDRKVASWFGVVFIAGLLGMVWVALVAGIPYAIGMIGWIWHNLTHPSWSSLAFWESAAVFCLTVGRYAMIPALAWRERRLRQAGVLR